MVSFLPEKKVGSMLHLHKFDQFISSVYFFSNPAYLGNDSSMMIHKTALQLVTEISQLKADFSLRSVINFHRMKRGLMHICHISLFAPLRFSAPVPMVLHQTKCTPQGVI